MWVSNLCLPNLYILYLSLPGPSLGRPFDCQISDVHTTVSISFLNIFIPGDIRYNVLNGSTQC